jgi:putative phosphoesterase
MKSRIGVISDTHGLLRPQALAALAGVDQIIHAGDVGADGILERLAKIAPVSAVRGNVDRGAWAEQLPAREVVLAAGISLYVLHDRDDLDLDPAAAGLRAVISGHSHRAQILAEASVLYLNPGSAGPRRFSLPVTLAIVEIADGVLSAQVMTLC